MTSSCSSPDLVALVHDPALPDPDPQPAHDVPGAAPADGQGEELVSETAAVALLTEVIARYGQLIQAGRRDGMDPQRLDELVAQWQACMRDRTRLQEADAGEVARLVARYAARLKELKAS
ncbi:hypothetical protein ACGFYV_35830 [Streptomyces sp. NPDC048297]|uniref:hypothetical protein n=1 Tax=Streptomyces sp. NPDC048297 TaxID=3365531 RepID=UPI0037248B1C